MLYGCELRVLILRREHRLRVFENRVLLEVFGSKREEITREWKEQHDVKLQDLYTSLAFCGESNQGEWEGPSMWHIPGEKKNIYRIFAGEPERNTSFEAPRHRWEDAIKTELKEVGWKGVDWISLAEFTDKWLALNDMILNIHFPYSTEFLE